MYVSNLFMKCLFDQPSGAVSYSYQYFSVREVQPASAVVDASSTIPYPIQYKVDGTDTKLWERRGLNL